MNLAAVIAGVGVAGVAGLLLMKTTKAAAPVVAPPAGGPTYPANDAAIFRAPPVNLTQTYTVNGRSFTKTFVPTPGNAASDVATAVSLAGAGHGAGAEGETWARQAVVDGATAAQVAQLRALKYGV